MLALTRALPTVAGASGKLPWGPPNYKNRSKPTPRDNLSTQRIYRHCQLVATYNWRTIVVIIPHATTTHSRPVSGPHSQCAVIRRCNATRLSRACTRRLIIYNGRQTSPHCSAKGTAARPMQLPPVAYLQVWGGADIRHWLGTVPRYPAGHKPLTHCKFAPA